MNAKILALDTATENCSAAIMLGDEVIHRTQVSPRGHTTSILPMVDEVLAEAGVSLQQLDAIAYGRGPGSFTGVRIGIGIAQGLAFGAELPMLGISTLQAMAEGAYRTEQATNVVAAIDARMSEVYWGRFSRQTNGEWLSDEEECVIAPQALLEQALAADALHETWTEVGTGWDAYPDLAQLGLKRTRSGVLYPQAQDIVVLAQHAWKKGEQVQPEQAAPVYLRDKVAWKKLPGRE